MMSIRDSMVRINEMPAMSRIYKTVLSMGV